MTIDLDALAVDLITDPLAKKCKPHRDGRHLFIYGDDLDWLIAVSNPKDIPGNVEVSVSERMPVPELWWPIVRVIDRHLTEAAK